MRKRHRNLVFHAITAAVVLISLHVLTAYAEPGKAQYVSRLPWQEPSDPQESSEATVVGELGNTFEGFGCANWSAGRYPGYKFAISFRTRYAKVLDHMWICWKTAPGYGAGNYGKWVFELRANHATNRTPSGNVIARIGPLSNPPEGYYRLDFPDVQLEAATIYHLVMYNTDPNPAINWSSPNTIMGAPDQPWRGEGVMMSDGTEWFPWGSQDNRVAPRSGGRAAYLLQYKDGTSEGMPYYSATQRLIYGDHYEGEQFTWWQEDVTIRHVGFPAFAVGKPAAGLEYVVEKVGAGTVAGGVLAGPARVTALPSWFRAALNPPVTVERGATYRIYLKAPGCTSEQNCYGIFVPYSSTNVPGWAELTWGGKRGMQVYYDGTWQTSAVPADLTFSMTP